jgi:hypothetical protein
MADTERLFAALERETGRLSQAGKPAEAARLAADAAAGKTDDLQRVAETLTPREPAISAEEAERRWAKTKEHPKWVKVMEKRAAEAARPKPTTAQWHLRDILRDGDDLFRTMDAKFRHAPARVAARDENLFRDMITELDDARYAQLEAALIKDLKETKSVSAIADDAQKAIKEVRDARVMAVREAIGDGVRGAGGQLIPAADTAARIQQKLPMTVFDEALKSRVASMERRLAEFEKVAAETTGDAQKTARNAANKLKRDIRKINEWGSDPATRAARQQEVAQLHQAIENNLPLRDLLHHGGGQMLMESAIEMLFGETLRSAADIAKSPVKTIQANFAEYLATRMSHFRGNFGEWELAFDLSKQGHVILKCGDEFVSRTGTDLVTMLRENGRWRMLIFDNKALRDSTVSEVTAMMDNLLKNLKDDQLKFAAIAKRADAPIEFAEASKRLESVTGQIETILTKYGGKMTKEAQAEIAQALAIQDVQLVVSNAGGQVKGISKPLTTMMDFYPTTTGPLPPARPIPTPPGP